MPDLIEELTQAMNPKDSCKLCDILAELSPDAVSLVLEALSGKLGGRKIADILTRNGHPVSRDVIDSHRRKGHGHDR